MMAGLEVVPAPCSNGPLCLRCPWALSPHPSLLLFPQVVLQPLNDGGDTKAR